nr:MAG TPA: hypothetical protein [Caudoviricetes sp.]DAH95074.1 MAG TPA: hypothetical protein [Caudoviricetes sp.]
MRTIVFRLCAARLVSITSRMNTNADVISLVGCRM